MTDDSRNDANGPVPLTDKERLALRLTAFTLAREGTGKVSVIRRNSFRRRSLLSALRERDSLASSGDTPQAEAPLRRSPDQSGPSLRDLIEQLGEMRRHRAGLLPKERSSQIDAELQDPASEASHVRRLEEACAAATERVRRDPELFLEAGIAESLRREAVRVQGREAEAQRERERERENDA